MRRPPIIDPLREIEDEQDRRRMRENLAAACVLLVLLAAGVWLIDHLRTSAHVEMCLEAGHRNCAPLNPDFRP